MERCEKSVMGILRATDIGKFQPKCGEEEKEHQPAGTTWFHYVSIIVCIDRQMLYFNLSEERDR